jgi:hypothetical protein
LVCFWFITVAVFVFDDAVDEEVEVDVAVVVEDGEGRRCRRDDAAEETKKKLRAIHASWTTATRANSAASKRSRRDRVTRPWVAAVALTSFVKLFF